MTDQTLKDIDRAFKALEERDELLDKIRAEICEVAWDSNYGEEIAKDMVVDLTDALTIIDKYREPTGVESEGCTQHDD